MIFKTIVGPVAEGDFYFSRPYLDDRIWKYLESGSSVLISAPRRVGKTSFLKNIVDQKREGYLLKYHETESINRSNEYFKRLYKSLLEELTTRKKIWDNLTEIIKKNKIEKVGTGGIELKAVDLNYFDEFKRIVKEISIEHKLVFIIDEFSETVENIINDQGENEGKIFLHQCRELRQDSQIGKKLLFVFSGSIGLGNIAERIGAVKSINDLTELVIPPLSENEALSLVEMVTMNPELAFDREIQEYLLKSIHWLMPYYIQIILDEMDTILLQREDKLAVDTELIDFAIDEALKKRNYFEHWHTRLRIAFKGKEYTFAKEALNAVSKSEKGVSKAQIFDLAIKNELNEQYNIILRTLEYDGYLNLHENSYVFNSPLLKIWWQRNIAI